MATLPGPGIAVTATSPNDAESLKAADFCEVRADLWNGPRTEAISFVRQSPKPVIFTCRIPQEGGRFHGSDTERMALFARAVDAGAVLLDLEARSPLAPRAIREGWPVLLSVHDFAGMIPGLPELVSHIAAAGAAVAKLIPTAHRINDLAAIRSLLAGPTPIPLAAFAMGHVGLPSRVLALAWRSYLTYVAAGQSVAPGQLTIDRFIGTFGSPRPAKNHIALTEDRSTAPHDLLNLARVANQTFRTTSPDKPVPCVVPYPEAHPQDSTTLMSALDARAVLAFRATPAGGSTLAIIRPGPPNGNPELLAIEPGQPLASLFQRALARLQQH